MFPSNLNNLSGFVIAKQDLSESGSVSKSCLYFVLDLFALQCEIILVKKDRWFVILRKSVG